MASLNEIVRVALHYAQANAGTIMNVFHFELDGTVGFDENVLSDIAVWVEEVWGAAWSDIASGNCELTHFDADVMNEDGTVNRNLGGGLVGLVGGVGGEVQAAANSAYLLAYTPIPKARGSKYVPGVSEGSIFNGALDATVLGNLAILLGVFMSEWDSASGLTLTPGVLSKVLDTFVHFNNSGAIDTLPAYQRRRKAGVGI